MPTNKNASIRYQALDRCFRDFSHRYYIDDLIEKCEEALCDYNGHGSGVSRRQVFEDIKFMESEAGWRIPLERKKDGKKVYYRYSNDEFSINRQPLTDEETRQFRAVIVALSRFRGLSSNDWIEEVISNLEWRFDLRGTGKNLIGFEQNVYLRGLNYLSPIIDAAYNCQVLQLVYRNYKAPEVERTVIVHPRYVKQYNNRWFLLAEDNEHHYISIFALDRILSLKVQEDIPFISDEKTDFEHFFDDVIGVTIPHDEVEKERIVLRFSKKQFPYIASKPLHHSQKIVDKDTCTVAIDVRPTYELEQQILSFGSDVEVIEPQVYRDYIKNKLLETVKKYTAVQIGCTDKP